MLINSSPGSSTAAAKQTQVIGAYNDPTAGIQAGASLNMNISGGKNVQQYLPRPDASGLCGTSFVNVIRGDYESDGTSQFLNVGSAGTGSVVGQDGTIVLAGDKTVLAPTNLTTVGSLNNILKVAGYSTDGKSNWDTGGTIPGLGAITSVATTAIMATSVSASSETFQKVQLYDTGMTPAAVAVTNGLLGCYQADTNTGNPVTMVNSTSGTNSMWSMSVDTTILDEDTTQACSVAPTGAAAAGASTQRWVHVPKGGGTDCKEPPQKGGAVTTKPKG